ncbi:hypothetical protein [Halobacillus andaensis]|uniref:hypothetical protein n=1 Tax=Halobacillus andaensis TaxID=1176239 RepID=UPI003D71F8A1
MWNQFKNKFKGFFDDDDSREYKKAPYSTNERDRNELNANTKMTYRYPKQGNFRFPVIPDHSKPIEEQETPERPSRKRARYSSQEGDAPAPKSSKRRNRTPSEEQRSNKVELPETPAEPFTPTDVPSPVYGFHPRSTPATNFEELPGKDESNGKTAKMEQARYDEEHWQIVRQRVLGKLQSSKQAKEEQESAETESAAASDFKTEAFEEDNPEFDDAPSSLNRVPADEAETENEILEEEIGSFPVTEEQQDEAQAEVPAEDWMESGFEPKHQADEEAGFFPAVEENEVVKPAPEEDTNEAEVESGHRADDEEAYQEIGASSASEQEHEGHVEKTAEEQMDVEVKTKPQPVENKKSNKQSNREKRMERKSVPFNVVMTPRDKRSRDQQKKL